jgi:hypothetical protein
MMLRRFLSALAALSLLLMPLGMIGGAAQASPHHPATATAHHAGTDHGSGESHDEPLPDRSTQCMMACAALPAAALDLPAAGLVPRALPVKAPAEALPGLSPEAAIPPPRFS